MNDALVCRGRQLFKVMPVPGQPEVREPGHVLAGSQCMAHAWRAASLGWAYATK